MDCNVPTYTNQQMLDRARHNYAMAMDAQALGTGTRHLERADLGKLQAAIDYWQEKVDADLGLSSNGGVVYANFNPFGY